MLGREQQAVEPALRFVVSGRPFHPGGDVDDSPEIVVRPRAPLVYSWLLILLDCNFILFYFILFFADPQ